MQEMKQPTEKWKPVENFPGYEISDQGRLRSYWRSNGTGPYGLCDISKILKPGKHKFGYHIFCLTRNGEKKYVYAHSLVLETFVGPRPDGCVSRHGPAGSKCHALHNLSWGTQSQNAGEDRRRDGTEIFGEKHVQAVFTDEDIRKIRRLRSFGMKQQDIANLYGCMQPHISMICLRKIWKHVPDDGNTP